MMDLLQFLEHSPTYFHATELAKKELASKGFTELKEHKDFKLKPSGKYFVVRDESALIAFITPAKEIQQAAILMSHSDSPAFRIKPHGEFQEDNMLLWALEVYGSPIYSSWMNRDCGFAGRVFYEKDGKVDSSLINIDDAPVMITQLPIHIDRTVNSEGTKVCAKKHLSALATLVDGKAKKKEYLLSLLEKKVKSKTILGHDLFLYPLDPPRFLGDQKDLFASARIDNLVSMRASLDAILKQKTSQHQLNMIYVPCHEEIGSKTFSGADSLFFKSIFKRICYHFDSSYENFQKCISQSLALSIDGSHALDPKSKDYFDLQHTPLLGGGIAIKIDASAAYAYSAKIVANIRSLARKNHIKLQNFVKKGDGRQGSTIGPIFVEKMGIQTLDLGLAQLSMHSIREVASCRDYQQLVKLLGLVLKNQL